MTSIKWWLFSGVVVLFCVFTFVRIYEKFAPQDPAIFSETIYINPDRYTDVESVTDGDLVLHAYDFAMNQYKEAFHKSSQLPELADSNGRVPVFKFDSDVFLVLNKRVSYSSGLALSNKSKFKEKIEAMDGRFSVSHIKGTTYSWHLNLNRDKSGVNEQ